MRKYRIEYRKPQEPDTHIAILPDGGLLVPSVHDDADLLLLAADTIRKLADQQAMPDGFYLEALSRLDAAISGVGEETP